MAVTPSGILSEPLGYLRDTIAASTAFQAWVGAADAAEAKESIYPVAARVASMPYCVIDWAENWARIADAGGTRNHFAGGGDLVMTFQAAIADGLGEADAAWTFMNNVGAVISDMEKLAGTDPYLNITEISKENGPVRPTEDEVQSATDAAGNLIGDFYQATFRVVFEGA